MFVERYKELFTLYMFIGYAELFNCKVSIISTLVKEIYICKYMYKYLSVQIDRVKSCITGSHL